MRIRNLWDRRGRLLTSVVLLFPTSFWMACATGTAVHVEPPTPQIENVPASNGLAPDSAAVPIEPDRPDVTNGTHIVDEGLLQVEIGVQHSRLGTNERSVGTPLTVRVGLLEWLEARAGTDGFLYESDGSSSARGVGNVQLGAKLRLFADPGGIPVLSILPAVNLPTASSSKGLGTGDPDITLVLLTGTDLGRTSHLDFNYGIGAIGAGHGRPHFAQHLVSLSASYSATEQLSPYIEGFWFSKQDPDGRPVFSIDGGLIHALTARLAVDGGVALGLTSAAPSLSLFAGVSMIVGDVLGDHGVIARQRKAAKLHSRPSH